jgi:hypothetical protein
MNKHMYIGVLITSCLIGGIILTVSIVVITNRKEKLTIMPIII